MRIKRVTLSEFKAAVGKDQRELFGAPVMVPKACASAVTKAVDENGEPADRALDWVISTGAVDRDNDTVNPDGWELDNFRRGGVVLWGHNQELPPIARPSSTRVEAGKLLSRAHFPDRGKHELADLVYDLAADGIVRNASVGFRPLEWELNEDRGPTAVDFKRQELLEWSVVAVAANAEALQQAARKGLNTKSLYEWAERCLDGDVKLLVPRSDIEAVRKAVKPVKSNRKVAVAKRAISWDAAHPEGTPRQDAEAEWDGSAEIAAADVDGLKVMSAWHADKPEDELVKADFKLPHHVAAGEHAVNWRGVAAAMAALLGARDGVDIPDDDRQGVYDHLAKHYRDDFEREPPEFRSLDENDEDRDNKSAGGVTKKITELIAQAHALLGEALEALEADEAEPDDSDQLEDIPEGLRQFTAAVQELTAAIDKGTVTARILENGARGSATTKPSQKQISPEHMAEQTRAMVRRLWHEGVITPLTGRLPD